MSSEKCAKHKKRVRYHPSDQKRSSFGSTAILSLSTSTFEEKASLSEDKVDDIDYSELSIEAIFNDAMQTAYSDLRIAISRFVPNFMQ